MNRADRRQLESVNRKARRRHIVKLARRVLRHLFRLGANRETGSGVVGYRRALAICEANIPIVRQVAT